MADIRKWLRWVALGVSLAAALGMTLTAGAQAPDGGGSCAGGNCAGGNCGGGGNCANSGYCISCESHHCPPAYRHCQEGAPCIKFICGCPRPVCCPCDKPNWGYYQTCWRPWPWPPNFSHCAPPGPAAFVPMMSTERRDAVTALPPVGEAPLPKKMEPTVPR